MGRIDERTKQDWSPRISHVWVLSREWLSASNEIGSTIRVFYAEEDAVQAMAATMRKRLKTMEGDEQIHDQKAEILRLLEGKFYEEAMYLWEDFFQEKFTWLEFKIKGERP